MAAEAISVESHAERRALHPFPTRRSSDLDDVRQAAGGLGRGRRLGGGRAPVRGGAAGTARTGARPPPSRRPRSEEHTAELQSRLQLVRRLQLEKKTTLDGNS